MVDGQLTLYIRKISVYISDWLYYTEKNHGKLPQVLVIRTPATLNFHCSLSPSRVDTLQSCSELGNVSATRTMSPAAKFYTFFRSYNRPSAAAAAPLPPPSPAMSAANYAAQPRPQQTGLGGSRLLRLEFSYRRDDLFGEGFERRDFVHIRHVEYRMGEAHL